MSDTHRKRVEEVLLEGDLLEVTTDETTQMWQVCGRGVGVREEEGCVGCVMTVSLSLCVCSSYKLTLSVPRISPSLKRRLLLRVTYPNCVRRR